MATWTMTEKREVLLSMAHHMITVERGRRWRRLPSARVKQLFRRWIGRQSFFALISSKILWVQEVILDGALLSTSRLELAPPWRSPATRCPRRLSSLDRQAATAAKVLLLRCYCLVLGLVALSFLCGLGRLRCCSSRLLPPRHGEQQDSSRTLALPRSLLASLLACCGSQEKK